MILARLIPKHSKKYENFNKDISVYADLIEKYNVINLFIVWIITASGFSYLLGQIDRYSYWDWSGFTEGTLRLILSTILYYVTSKTEMLKLGNGRVTYLDLFFKLIICFMFFLIGAVSIRIIEINIIGFLPYVCALLAGIYIYEFKISYDKENDDWVIDSWENKVIYLAISLILMIVSTVLGYELDDPIISTVSMVSLFFPAVALVWPNHVRHIKRLQFYPLFILAMFTCVRSPWFLIILWALFFIIRSINYLKYGITYPSFGVAEEETIADV